MNPMNLTHSLRVDRNVFSPWIAKLKRASESERKRMSERKKSKIIERNVCTPIAGKIGAVHERLNEMTRLYT